MELKNFTYSSGINYENEEKVEIITLDYKNIEAENIVCARSKDKIEAVNNKKEWLKARFKDGLKFKILKINGRSQGLIEYIQADNGFRPIDAPGYMLINCFWIIGKFKGKGYGSMLFEECIKDAKKTNGIVVLTSNKTTMPGKKFFLNKGFEICDKTHHIELLVKRFKKTPLPEFKENAKKGIIENDIGVTFLYSDECPYILSHLNDMVEVAKFYGIPAKAIKLTSKEQAQNSPSPLDTFSVFYNGKFLMHGIHKNYFARFLSKVSV